MTYGEMKTQFQGLLNRRDITPTQVTMYLQQAIARCQRQLRIPAMEKAKLVTVGTSYNGITIPHDFLQLISLEASDGVELRKVNAQEARTTAAGSTGIPRVYARKGTKWFLGPTPAVGDTIRMDYFAQFSPLVADGDTNVLTTIAPDLPINAALSYACDFYQDDRAPLFEGRYGAIKQELMDQANLDELSGNAVVGPAYEFPPD